METRKSYRINGYVKTHVGLVRRINEDNFLFGTQLNENCSSSMEAGYSVGNELKWNCFCVFDGIGGAEYGELASRYAAEVAAEYSKNMSSDMSYEMISEMAQKIFLEANNKVVKAREETSVCGTTGTLFVTDGVMAKIFHVGDSRAYLFRDGELYRLTKDDTLAQLKVDAGFYKNINEASEKELHQLTEFIGRDETMQYFKAKEGTWMDFRAGDQILLCSDGLYDLCLPGQIKDVLKQEMFLKEKVEKLIESVLKNGARDNVTCVLLEKKED